MHVLRDKGIRKIKTETKFEEDMLLPLNNNIPLVLSIAFWKADFYSVLIHFRSTRICHDQYSSVNSHWIQYPKTRHAFFTRPSQRDMLYAQMWWRLVARDMNSFESLDNKKKKDDPASDIQDRCCEASYIRVSIGLGLLCCAVHAVPVLTKLVMQCLFSPLASSL